MDSSMDGAYIFMVLNPLLLQNFPWNQWFKLTPDIFFFIFFLIFRTPCRKNSMADSGNICDLKWEKMPLAVQHVYWAVELSECLN